jgi:hypothetical protein
MTPRPDTVTVVEPGRQAAATATAAPTPLLRANVHPQLRTVAVDDLRGHDHDLTTETEDRSK